MHDVLASRPMSRLLSRHCQFRYHRLAATILLSLTIGCVGADDPAVREESFAELPRQDYRFQLPDGRIAVGTGIRNGDALLIEGDVMIPLREGKGSNSTAAVTSNLWPTKVIVYEFDPAVDATTRQRVIDAMNPWRSAGIIFRQRTNQSSFVRITTEYLPQYPWVCAVATIGYQQVNTYYAGRNCRMRDFVHEWGHILGLFHEHQRTDRDQFVIADPSIGGTIAGMGSDWGTYDFGSIMHYDAYQRNADGSVNYNQVLITPRDGRSLNSFGWNETPSYQDLSAVSSLYANRLPGVPLYQLYNYQYQDWFYTTNPNERLVAMQYYGYSDQGVTARVEPSQEGGAAPFWRFYKGPPQTDHFYTTSQSEYDYVIPYGWVYEGVEGYLYTYQVEGTTPLYRYSHWDGATSDLMHFYTVYDWYYSYLVGSGWGYDGVAGYVYMP